MKVSLRERGKWREMGKGSGTETDEERADGNRLHKKPQPLLSSAAGSLVFFLGFCLGILFKLRFFTPRSTSLLEGDGPKASSSSFEDPFFLAYLPSWANEKNYVFEDIYSPSESQCHTFLYTAGDQLTEVDSFLRLNRVEYCKVHRCCYAHLKCAAEGQGLCESPHFWRYIGVLKARSLPTEVEWVLYMDTDTMITNFEISIENFAGNVVRQANKDRDNAEDVSVFPSLIIGTDASCDNERYPINNGVFLFRPTPFTLYVAQQTLTRRDYLPALKATDAWGAHGLIDQPLLVDVLVQTGQLSPSRMMDACVELEGHRSVLSRRLKTWRPLVCAGKDLCVVPGRQLNSLRRGNKYEDLKVHEWHRGDWVAHFSGVDDPTRRLLLSRTCTATQALGSSEEEQGGKEGEDRWELPAFPLRDEAVKEGDSHRSVCPFDLGAVLSSEDQASVEAEQRQLAEEAAAKRDKEKTLTRVHKAVGEIQTNGETLTRAVDFFIKELGTS
eukprot:Cvel_7965.t1-p1 / transcript=Cvel_7965.t1 / gene=Cvel_7965 / organism=Chromera_velia_CCMP2878 / gene_product=hypothetical protein / transcript_product=hypothetical protein / location=Cvel_scaffold429:1392-3279(-) / protein_length=498 / sequence_SO=supercontig / SO=protein_coding / is_pseudo=false